ncbi:MAG: hypothetical protein KAJ42_12400, partial [Gemmatimonadetes bacterium]|nr:hypothetical protein [Gemmatimonadota bacterium]
MDVSSDAVRVRISWRRRDPDPEQRKLIVLDASTGARIDNLVRVNMNRVFGDLIFQPATGAGEYHVYYLPHTSTGRRNYPTVEYPPPVATAEEEWLRRNGLSLEGAQGRWSDLPEAEVVEIQAVDELNSFFPMEVIATREETEALAQRDPNASFLLFPEDRTRPIRMVDDLPFRWAERGAGGVLIGDVLRGEFYVLQIGVFAHRERLEDLQTAFTDLLASSDGPRIPAANFTVFNLKGVDSKGRDFVTRVDVEKGKVLPLWIGVQIPEDAEPGRYQAGITVRAQGAGHQEVGLVLRVSDTVIEAAGDDEPWRLSRLRWLNSRISLDDQIVPPFTPVRVSGDTVSVLGRRVTLDAAGFPTGIESFFAPEMTHLVETPRQLLRGPVRLTLTDDDGEWGVESPGG